jgi:DNA-damage-inducible protein D
MRVINRRNKMDSKEMDTTNKIAIFKGKEIRKTIHNGEWWFSVVDVVAVLTDSTNPRDYWYKMKIRVKSEDGIELSTNCLQLKLESTDGKKYKTDCANTESVFRLIQSIPSPKAEPFKRWLAKVGYERIQEIEDPEIASKRMREIYRAKGYSDAWIEKRMRGIAVRDELTNEWGQRGVKEQVEYSILTAEISKATFGMTPSKYKEYKGLQRENLRDHMTDLELIFTMLGEASTTKIAVTKDAQGFDENKVAAKKGGEVAGSARKDLESKIGDKITTKENYIEVPEKVKRIKGKK